MVKSIRISDEMYDRAQTSAALLHRSLNQQIEYWVALGQLLDQSLSRDELMAALIKNGHARDEQAVQSGALRQEDLFRSTGDDPEHDSALLTTLSRRV